MNLHFLPNRVALAALVLIGLGCGSGGGGTPSPSTTSSASPPVTAVAPAGPRCVARSPRRIERAATAGASSSVDLVRAGSHVYALVADYDERALHAVDAETMRQIGVTPLPGRPGHVLALDSGLVAVALRDTGRVIVLEPSDDGLSKPFEERCSATVATEPWTLAQTGESLLVGSGFGAALTILRTADLGADRVIPLPREPRAVLVANAGSTAFVTHAVGGIVSAIDLKDPARAPEPIRLQAGRRIAKDGGFDDKSTREASQGYALARVEGPRKDGARDALRIFAPHTSVDPGALGAGASGGYGGPGPRPVAQIVSVVDPVARRSITNHVEGAFHAHLAQECILPRSAVADDNGLFVACLDIDAVLELDPWIGDPSVAERRRFALPAGPSAVALGADGKRIFAWSEIDRALSRIERESAAIVSLPLWRRSGEPRDERVDRGRRLFHSSRDARIAQGRACASCHPDGRDDGLVWTSPDGPRQTVMLAGRIEGTAPYGWFGEHLTVRDHVTHTFTRLNGTGFDMKNQIAAEDFEALLAYLASLPLPPAVAALEAKAVERGKDVFSAYGCEGCHRGGGGTDGLSHDVGTGLAGERSAAFDTPSLRRVRGTAPYFHDGRYATLEEMLSAKDQKMFNGTLTEPDKKALLAYLETL
ncbi:c-type cytochrome [Polyangium aurulentum]|uniref:c-type cytochrome n=1 Tax=Polyangium aurulentum TaxID=2567896 RepID=UPI00146D5E98|nr:c-type cytochrome [Polyangium aurulentum]UQA63143.1 c-type cytochrome [Polyangium aurulentum]